LSLAPQEPTSSLLRSGAKIGKKEVQEGEDDEEEEERGVELAAKDQGGHEGRRNQLKRLIERPGEEQTKVMKTETGWSFMAAIKLPLSLWSC